MDARLVALSVQMLVDCLAATSVVALAVQWAKRKAAWTAATRAELMAGTLVDMLVALWVASKEPKTAGKSVTQMAARTASPSGRRKDGLTVAQMVESLAVHLAADSAAQMAAAKVLQMAGK
jgi:hypothetical protein